MSWLVNGLAAALGAFAVLSYAFAYTPLKRTTPLCVFVGAVPGALPPVIGWAASTGGVGAGALLLFATMFFWQLPHFAAIAWLYRNDYARAGFPMLAVVDDDGGRTNLHVVTHSVGLLAASVLPTLYGVTGFAYGIAALVVGTLFLIVSVWFLARKTRETARLHLFASVAYLPCLFGFMVLDKIGPG
jgi:protoheme IX farnesyltransferase